MNAFAAALTALLFVSSAMATPPAPLNCSQCTDLKKIEDLVRKPKEAKPDYDGLQLVATSIIQKMPDSKRRLTDAQVTRVVGMFDAIVDHDPAAAIVENNLDIVKANRSALDREIGKLPKDRAQRLQQAIKIGLGSENPNTGFEDDKPSSDHRK